MRLNRFLAAAGLGSRRKCEELIVAGRVTINGQLCQNLATEVTGQDFVKVGSKRVQPEQHLYLLLHKPRGFIATASDTHERRTIFDLLPTNFPRVFHVGRLDRDSEGLLILTNDGDLGLRLTHPRYKVDKEYEVALDRPFNMAEDKIKLIKGVHIQGGRAHAESVWLLTPKCVRVVLRQGLKRQIRLMFYKLGYEVERLVRTRIGDLRIGDLRPGEWRNLTAAEIKSLQQGGVPSAPAPGAKSAQRATGGGKVSRGREGEPRPERAKTAGGQAGRSKPERFRAAGPGPGPRRNARAVRPGGAGGRRRPSSAPKGGARP